MNPAERSSSSGSSVRLPLETIAEAIRASLCGPDHEGRPEVIWTDGGSQILLHVSKLQLHLTDAAVVVAVDTESTEFGVAPLMVRFVFGREDGPTSLVAATDARAFGDLRVAARWGDLFRDVVWASLARVVDAVSGGRTPAGIALQPEGFVLRYEKQFSIRDLAISHVQDLTERGLRQPFRVERVEPEGRA